MGIEALPSYTVRTIGATQVLNDPASLTKELIDNALDAKSTCLSVEIHSNTLDSIQVRDNGHGIPAEDRLLVARPHCTSKITGEDDLKTIGGTSLGFRGEALASAAEMSGALTISTRVEGEEVATALKINQQGEVFGQDRASLPVGTTVKITDFIKAHPVRRQVALKNAEKTITKIKQTLKSYAFARPHVRLSLRVLKAKNDKGNWTYAPKPGGNAEDAAFKIVGTACASQCTWSVVEEKGYSLQAFLPRQDAEVSKYSNVGSFLSVDARPVSTARGTPKQILKIFRETLKKANPTADGVKEPFLFLNIQCPTASYDANVEPAKDDVLFEDTDTLIDLARRLFDAVYPSSEATPSIEETIQYEPLPSQTPHSRRGEEEFVTSLEPAALATPRNRDAVPWTPIPTDQVLPILEDDEVSPLGRTFRSNMYGCDEEDLEFLDDRPPTGRTEADFEELRNARNDVNVSNPWILAKMNASVRRQPAALDDGDDEYASDSRPQPQNELHNRMSEPENALPTPGPSSPTKPSGMVKNTWMAPAADTDGRSVGSSMLPPPGPTILPSPHGDVVQFEAPSVSPSHRAPAYNYAMPAQDEAQMSGTPLHMIPDSSSRRRASPSKPKQQGRANASFKPPTQDQSAREKVWFDHLEHIDERRPTKRAFNARNNDGLVMQGELGDLVDDPRPPTPPRRNRDMRDFLTPREDAAQQSITGLIEARQYPRQRRPSSGDALGGSPQGSDGENCEQSRGGLSGRGFVPASELAALEQRVGPLKPGTSRPLKRRKTSERRALGEVTGNAPLQDEPADEEHDVIVGSHAAFSRRRTTDGSTSKARRTKSSRLPLERVPKGQGTHNLVLEVSKGMGEISSIAGKIDEECSLLGWNEPSVDAHDVFAMDLDEEAVQTVTAKLHQLLAVHLPEDEVVQDLGAVIEGALAAHSQGMLEQES